VRRKEQMHPRIRSIPAKDLHESLPHLRPA
jgi:hypothetical protein